MAKKKKEVEIEAFELGKCDTKKNIDTQHKNLNAALDEVPDEINQHVRDHVQPWLDQISDANSVQGNATALHKASTVYNVLTNNLNPE